MALVLVLFILGMITTGLVVSSLNRATAQLEIDARANVQLNLAREAVLAYVLAANNSQRPGDLIRPDAASEPDYDGTADGGCLDSTQPNGLPLTSAGSSMRCLGRLPWKDFGLSVDSPTQNDSDGSMPWYAISANLVDPLCVTSLNPGIGNLADDIYTCPSTSNNITHPWLTVRDRLGNILSDRVAIVIMMPGAPINNQSRPAAALGGANQYLDSVTVSNACTANQFVAGTYSNADMDNDYIKGDDTRAISDGDPCFDGTYAFNDKLVYITIDDLMAEATKRAAAEARSLLNNYSNANARYPYAADLGSAVGNFISSGTSNNGMLPIDGTDSCSCSSSTSCTCNFGLVASASFRRSGTATWSANNISGACTRPSTQVCSCTGAGRCRNSSGTRNFTCDSSGNCTHNTTGTYTFAPKTPHGTIETAAGSCSKSGTNVNCNGNGTFTIGLNEATWFSDNLWQNFFHYRWSSAADIQVGLAGAIGTRHNLQAVVISSGAPITSAPFASKGAAQIGAPSANLDDYLDSDENTDGDTEFDATNKSHTSSYNDQVFIVDP